MQTRRGGGQRDHATGNPDADVVELIRTAGRVAIVDDHDPL